MISKLFEGISDWFKRPFRSDGSAFNWLMFVGLVTIAAFLWNVILIDLTKEV